MCLCGLNGDLYVFCHFNYYYNWKKKGNITLVDLLQLATRFLVAVTLRRILRGPFCFAGKA